MPATAAIAPDIGELYLAHRGWLHAWLRRRLGCVHHAADLTHDTFVRLLARPRELDPARDPRAYLSTVAHGLVVDHWRRRTIEQAYRDALMASVADAPALAPSPEHHAAVVETLVQIDALLARLPERPRRAFLMAQLLGKPYALIAAELGVSERMVKMYIAQALLHCLPLAEALDEGPGLMAARR